MYHEVLVKNDILLKTYGNVQIRSFSAVKHDSAMHKTSYPYSILSLKYKVMQNIH